MKYKLHFSNHSLKYIMNSKRECLAISTPFVNILNYKLEKKGYEKISVGIGVDDGRALMVKAGFKMPNSH